MSVRELSREFESLTRSSTPLVAAWSRRHQPLAGCVELPDVVEAVRRAPDPALRSLLREVGAGCPLAARVILQALLPKVLVMSRNDRTAFTMDYVAHLWLRIIDYPLARRPDRIAANLVLDTLKSVRADRGQALVLLEPDQLHELPGIISPPDPEPTARGLLRHALDRSMVDPHTYNVLASVYADGLSNEETAKRFGVTPNTVQRRCTRGLRAIAARAEELVVA